MRRLFSLITIVLLAVIAGSQGVAHAQTQTQTQTQQHSIIIDESSFAPVQTDVMSGVAIDKIQPDNSRRPCARIKMHINRMTREEIDGIVVQPIGGSVVVMKQIVAAEGNGLIVELTAKQPTRFYLHHDKYGDSNEVSLNLEGDKEYRLSAQLNIAYPIFVKSNVAEAEVYIDNEYKGQTNGRYTLIVKDIRPGRHTLKIKYGTEVKEQDIEVTSNNLDFDIGLSTKASLPQIIEFSVEPANATVYINDTPYSAQRDGVVIIALNKGTYDYRVSADMYHDERGSLTVTDSTVSKSITLKPAYGWIEIGATSLLSGAHIYIDNEYAGTAPLKSGDLASGEHTLRVIQDMYLPYEEVIIITDNKTLTFNTAPLIADYATVTLSAGTGCHIYVDGEHKGITSWTGRLASGSYTFEARKENYRTTTRDVTISAEPTEQYYKLTPPTPIVGTISVTGIPSRTKVYVDNKFVGETPLTYNVIIGDHEIVAKADGYRSKKQSVTITEGTTTDLYFILEKGADTTNNVIEYISRQEISISYYESYTSFGSTIKSHSWDPATGRGVITFEGNVTKIGEQAFYGCDNLTSITIPNSVTTIGYSAFEGCRSLTSVTIPDGVIKIGERAFYGCGLSSIKIPDSVTTIGDEAFRNCTSLTSVTIGDSVTEIGNYAFRDCSSLTSVTIGDSVTTIGNYAFCNCDSLTSVTIPDSVTTIGTYAFCNCDSLTSVTIGDSVTTIGECAFSWCKNLTSVTIGDSVTELGNYAFRDCSSLTNVTIGDSVTTIGECAFYLCSSLTSITIPDSVTTIGEGAFQGCISLTSVTIGKGITSIGNLAFLCGGNLTSLYCKATTPPDGHIYMFANDFNIKIYVPKKSAKLYKRAAGWEAYWMDIKGYDFNK